jgi:hypothetical protein
MHSFIPSEVITETYKMVEGLHNKHLLIHQIHSENYNLKYSSHKNHRSATNILQIDWQLI